ncbi:MAG: UDP-N-acetylmuramoyl-L-alanyl-D-glutamate--2,6-diaminopimelate ligase [Acidobacteria bacterium]|nr:UDP-N-acetylmuramoyl-L-alanyl-D-glutamate--2,6-diaminopimelate ligase [Acidobacteriota bacterium]
MKFLDLLSGVETIAQSGNPTVSGVEYDSRRVKPGDVFVAMRGELTDGNCFTDRAIASGAVAVVSDSVARPEGVAWAQVPDGRRALACLSANFFRRPADRLAVTGITGTNGKSTTAFLLESMLKAAGRGSALVGTIEYHVGDKVLPAPHTTPESLELHRLFSEAVASGATETVMEVSSHALAQGRTYGIGFEAAVFTNLTRDHLDYHHTMDEYFAAKKMLFRGSGAKPPRVAVINGDDDYGQELVRFARQQGSEVITYGLGQGDFHTAKLNITVGGTEFDLVAPQGSLHLRSALIGRVNVYNILAASAAARARGCSDHAMIEGVRTLNHVPGRFERVDCGQPFTVIVDYAHTDDALRNLTALAREIVKPSRGRVITVFGCGGDRDRSKRPLMGEAAGQGSDFVVLTSDNPRSEDPLAIIEDAVVGLKRSRASFRTEPDRRRAIQLALATAAPGDMVLLAGKGHEVVQVVAGGSSPFADKSVAAEALRDLGYQHRAVHGAEKPR